MFAFISIVSAAFITPAAAEDLKVAGWDVGEIDSDSCIMALDYEGEGQTTLGLALSTKGSVLMSLTNYNWSAVPDRSYDLIFFLDGTSYADGKSIGYINGSKKGFLTTFEPDFVKHFAQSTYLTIKSKKGVTIDDLKLAGSAAALAQVRRCVARLKAVAAAEAKEKARISRIPEDPFAKIAGEGPSLSAPPRFEGNLASLVSPDDYPPSAFANNEQGRVSFRLTVNRDGRVTKCEITQTSGSPALDGATCRIMQARAHFKPARSTVGNPIEGSFESHVTWSLG